jgi:DNA modification methylase
MTDKKLEHVNLDALIPYARNAKLHSDAQVAQIAASIREFGFNAPVLIDGENGIIAGHGRVLAARKLGIQNVPCIRLTHLTEIQRRAYIIADNKLTLNSGWDEELLNVELAELDEKDFDLELTGFSAEELESLMSNEIINETSDPDQISELSESFVTTLGDVWVLDKHKLMCQDSTNINAVELLTAESKWDRLIFDPPYEIEELYSTAMLPQKQGAKLISFWDFKRFAIACKTAMEFGWSPLYELVWDNVTSWYTPNRPLARHKSCGIFGDDPKWNFDEAIIQDGKKRECKTVTNSRGTCEYKPLNGAVHLRTVEAFPTTAESGGHAHSKPLKWIEAIFRGIGGNCFLDLFGGSGSTLIACEIIGTQSCTMELNPGYCDIIVKRWQYFTGKNAINTKTGKTFNEMNVKI